jgi:hypothetical protein
MTTPNDPRLRRPSDDAMPSHRQCSKCLEVKPLDVEHFYVKRAAYEWQLSRFMPYCIDCDRARVRDYYHANKAARNARSAQAHRVLKANTRELGGPARMEARRAAREARRAEEHARKQRKAKVKRLMLKRYGPRPDGIKALIRARVEMYFERRRRSTAEPKEFRRVAQASHDLEAIRARHRAEFAQRPSSSIFQGQS